MALLGKGQFAIKKVTNGKDIVRIEIATNTTIVKKSNEGNFTPNAVSAVALLRYGEQVETIGGVNRIIYPFRNLVKGSRLTYPLTGNSTKYNIGSWSGGGKYIKKENTYTILAELYCDDAFSAVKNSGIGFWISGSASLTPRFKPTTPTLVTLSFTASMDGYLTAYHYPSGTAGNTYINWVMLVEGNNIPPEWQPAPEDVVLKLNGAPYASGTTINPASYQSNGMTLAATWNGNSSSQFVPVISDGATGINTAPIVLYKRSNQTPPARPTNISTWSFAEKKFTTAPNNGWLQAIPISDGIPLWAIHAIASSNSPTDDIPAVEWTIPENILNDGSNGSDGYTQQVVVLHKRSSTPIARHGISSTLTYTFADGRITGSSNGWTVGVPAGEGDVYVVQAIARSLSASDTIASSEWSEPVCQTVSYDKYPQVLIRTSADAITSGESLNPATISAQRVLKVGDKIVPINTEELSNVTDDYVETDTEELFSISTKPFKGGRYYSVSLTMCPRNVAGMGGTTDITFYIGSQRICVNRRWNYDNDINCGVTFYLDEEQDGETSIKIKQGVDYGYYIYLYMDIYDISVREVAFCDYHGRNYLNNSNKFLPGTPLSGISGTTTSKGYLQIVSQPNNSNYISILNASRKFHQLGFLHGDTITAIFEIKTTAFKLPMFYFNQTTGYVQLQGQVSSSQFNYAYCTVKYYPIFESDNSEFYHLGFRDCIGTTTIKSIKFIKGEYVQQEWQPAPEDATLKLNGADYIPCTPIASNSADQFVFTSDWNGQSDSRTVAVTPGRSLDYLKKAFQGTTKIEGGVVQSSVALFEDSTGEVKAYVNGNSALNSTAFAAGITNFHTPQEKKLIDLKHEGKGSKIGIFEVEEDSIKIRGEGDRNIIITSRKIEELQNIVAYSYSFPADDYSFRIEKENNNGFVGFHDMYITDYIAKTRYKFEINLSGSVRMYVPSSTQPIINNEVTVGGFFEIVNESNKAVYTYSLVYYADVSPGDYSQISHYDFRILSGGEYRNSLDGEMLENSILDFSNYEGERFRVRLRTYVQSNSQIAQYVGFGENNEYCEYIFHGEINIDTVDKYTIIASNGIKIINSSSSFFFINQDAHSNAISINASLPSDLWAKKGDLCIDSNGFVKQKK